MAVRKDGDNYQVPIIGECPSLLDAVKEVEKAANFSYLSVLVTGESGTGKEIAARKYHAATKRQGLFISVNCAAIPDSLVATELMGAERGAFTGADRIRQGVFELANGGTLFLDEIGDASPELQKALLRILEDQEFRRVGGSKPIKVDVRVIAATNKDLEKMSREGTFREDLFYRLHDISIQLPPLRQRDDDALLIARRYLEELPALGGPELRFSKEAELFITEYPWPGNVRQLKKVVRSLSVYCEGDVVSVDDLRHALGINMQIPKTLSGEERRRRLLELFEEGEPLKASDIRRMFNIPTTTLFYDLQRLVKLGAIEKRKTCRGVFYTLSDGDKSTSDSGSVNPAAASGETPDKYSAKTQATPPTTLKSEQRRGDENMFEEQILGYMSKGKSATAAELELVLHLSRAQVTRYLNKLIEMGRIGRIGKGKLTQYIYINPDA